jgi:hypothetical protein
VPDCPIATKSCGQKRVLSHEEIDVMNTMLTPSSLSRSALVCCTSAATVAFESHSIAAAETRFTIVDGPPGTWVARGLSDYIVSEADGWFFKAAIGSFWKRQ